MFFRAFLLSDGITGDVLIIHIGWRSPAVVDLGRLPGLASDPINADVIAAWTCHVLGLPSDTMAKASSVKAEKSRPSEVVCSN
jgi:hypothetical protein